MNNLGIALGAYTDEMNRQREQQRADAANQRQQQQFDLQMQEAERAKGIRSQRESEVQRLQQIRGALANPNDPANWTVLQQAAKDYGVGNIERMGNSVGVFAGGEQGVPQFRPLDLGAYTKLARERLAMLEPESAMAYMDSVDARAYDEGWKNKTFGLKTRELDDMMDYRNRLLSLQEREMAANTAYRNAALALRGQGGGRDDPYGVSDEEAAALNQAIEYEEVAKQLARTNPAAAQQYRLAAVEAMRSVRPRTQLAMRAKLGASPQEAVDDWDRPVKVKRATDQGEIEMTVPLRVADPEGYARYLREQQAAMFMPEPGSSFFGGGQTAAPSPQPGRGLFTAPDGRTQLLQPLYDLNEFRRRMQEQSNQ